MTIATARICVENQHYVLCQPFGDGPIGAPWTVLRVYAKTAEAALEAARKLFAFDDYCQEQTPPEGCVRLAVAWELPWNQPTEATVIKLDAGPEFVGYYPEGYARELYGAHEIISLRAPTLDELETSMRQMHADEDERDEEEFQRGWDDYKYQLENGEA